MESFGKIAYEAYCADTGGKSLISGSPLQAWDKLDTAIQHAWEAVGDALVGNPQAVGAPFDRVRAILEMLDRLREKFPKLSLADLIAIATAAGKLLPLPDLADEAACRKWAGQLVAVIDEISKLTTVTIDDQIVDAFLNVVESDDLWGLVWRIVEWVVPDEGILVSCPDPPLVMELGERLGIDCSKLAVLIQAIIDFIKTWRS